MAFSHDVEAIMCLKDLAEKRYVGAWEGLIKGEDSQGLFGFCCGYSWELGVFIFI